MEQQLLTTVVTGRRARGCLARTTHGVLLLLSALIGAGISPAVECADPAQAAPEQRRELQSTELIRSGHSWNGDSLPAYPTGAPQITVMRISIPPGYTLPMHSHPVINAGVLLSGELRVLSAAGDTLVLRAGDPIIELVDTPHYGINEGDVPADIIVFYAGEAGRAISVPRAELSH